MRARYTRRVRSIIAAVRGASAASCWLAGASLAAILTAVVAIIVARAPIVEGEVDAASITKEVGEAYVVGIEPLRSRFYAVRGAAVGQRASGTLILLEDGRALGPSDTNHDEIRARGRGAYSYWDQALYFSTSDNTDPRSNGRTYAFQAQAAPRERVKLIGIGAGAVALLMSIAWLRSARRPGASGGRAVRLGSAVGSALDAVGKRLADFAPGGFRTQVAWAMLFAVAAAVALLFQWRFGVSGHLGAASLVPVSDAMGYYRCALMGAEGSATALGVGSPGAMTAFGIPGEWCSRRSIWPLSLVSLLSATGWHAGLALLVQASLIGAALGLLVASAWRAYGVSSAVLIGWIGTVFAVEWAIGTFMTENWGLLAGLTGAALLIEHARQRQAGVLALGLAMISVALAARAGALFALPLLLLWAYLTLLQPGRRWSLSALAVPMIALCAGLALQWAGAHHFVADASNTGGNFGPSLYGLSTGSRDWSQAYRDFAPLFAQKPEAEVFKIVQQRAIENIAARPGVFLDSLNEAAKVFRTTLFDFGGPSVVYTRALAGLLVAGLLYCVYRWREPPYSLPLVVFVAECLAAPLIVDSGGQRVFAATVWVRPLLAGIGIAALIRLTLLLLRVHHVSEGPRIERRPLPAMALACVVLALSTLPLLLPSGVLRPAAVDVAVDCGPGEIPAIARIGRESMAITVGPHRAFPLGGPLVVEPGRVESDRRWRESWWSNGMGSMPSGSTLMVAFDARPTAVRGNLLSLFSDRPLPPSVDGVYRLCAGEQVKRTLGDFQLRPLMRVEAVQPPASGR
jgi:hypothetical protein